MAKKMTLANVMRLGAVDRAVVDLCKVADDLKRPARRQVLAIAAALLHAEFDHLLDNQPDAPPTWPDMTREEEERVERTFHRRRRRALRAVRQRA